MKQHFLLFVLFLFSILSCRKSTKNDVAPVISVAHSTARDMSCYEGAKWEVSNYGIANEIRNNFSTFCFSTCGPPTPLIIAFHGGGFIMDSKDLMIPAPNSSTQGTLNFGLGFDNSIAPLLTQDALLANRIAYACPNYRYANFANGVSVANSLEDCKSFVAYMRLHAAEYNIDPNKIILMGCSAGSDAALWIGLRDPAIKGILSFSPQASLNFSLWRSQIFAPYNAAALYDSNVGLLAVASTKFYGTIQPAQINAFSNAHQLHFLDLIDASDPEILLSNNASDFLHSSAHVAAIKNRSNITGHNSKINFTANPSYLNPQAESIIQFCKRKFQLP